MSGAQELASILDRQARVLREELAALSQASDPLLADAAHELTRSIERLQELSKSVREAAQPWRLLNRLVFTLRLAAAARASLLRHTPPLAGQPAALHPVQRADAPEHFIEYARSGSRLYLDVGAQTRITARDHPLLAQAARHIAEVLYPSAPASTLLYGSATAAMNSALDLICERARQRAQRVAVGRRSWIEVREYARHQHADVVDFFDESDEAELMRVASSPGVAGVSAETLVNHPSFPAVPWPAACRAAGLTGKVLLVDCAHTPEVDPSAWQAGRAWPKDLVVLAVVSGVKFLQAGLDLSASGLLTGWGESSLWDELLEHRERSGRVPSYEDAFLADLETPATFRSRLERLDRNTRVLAETLQRAGCPVQSAWLGAHPARALYGTGGRFVYVSGRWPAKLDQRLCELAAREGLPAVAACTFGLAVPHANLIVDVPEQPVLRLSAGSGAEDEADAVAALWANALRGHPSGS